MRIECEQRGRSRHYVVHLADPRFTMEFAPDTEAPDRVVRGVLRRLCVPNSWAGDYGKYIPLLNTAQEFFTQSFGDRGAERRL